MKLLRLMLLPPLLSACATPPRPVQAAWYLEAESKGVHVALLNEGSVEIPLRKVIINPDINGKGREWKAPEGFLLHPGRLAVLKLASFEPPALPQDCVIPVSVLLESDSPTRIQATLAGRMPSSLPEEWLGCSVSPKP